ncbi:UNVERIFIED_CONTAM: hypothetical protein PYX00_004025 [Menopon gallinae]|uniref:Peroxisomal membrane protein 11C n=1 Tax=Menopon gallinae TaxID=328185 RepID=A0AAW2I445_9NEOP
MNLEKLLALLETYRGRDRFLRLLCYASKCGAGLTSPKISPQLDSLSKQLSSCRTALRLLDDIPTLVYVLQYGLGNKNEDKYVRFLTVISNIVDLIFCPVDHISWAIDHRIILSKSTKWDTLSTAMWVASLYLNIMISSKKMNLIFDQKEKLSKTKDGNREEMKKLSETQSKLFLNTLKSMLDIVYAVHYLPPGILWSGTLQKWQVGALGTLSSLIGLYQSLK